MAIHGRSDLGRTLYELAPSSLHIRCHILDRFWAQDFVLYRFEMNCNHTAWTGEKKKQKNRYKLDIMFVFYDSYTVKERETETWRVLLFHFQPLHEQAGRYYAVGFAQAHRFDAPECRTGGGRRQVKLTRRRRIFRYLDHHLPEL